MVRSGIALVVGAIKFAYHFSQLVSYTERNYMRARKNERKLRRYGQRLSMHEMELRESSSCISDLDKRLRKVEGFGR